jgi:hypothetical protein
VNQNGQNIICTNKVVDDIHEGMSISLGNPVPYPISTSTLEVSSRQRRS